MVWPLAIAEFTTASAPAKLNWFWLGSVVSHFIAFSGVTPLNSRLRTVRYIASLASGLVSTAAPMMSPRAVARLRSVSACAGVAARTTPARPSTPHTIAVSVFLNCTMDLFPVSHPGCGYPVVQVFVFSAKLVGGELLPVHEPL